MFGQQRENTTPSIRVFQAKHGIVLLKLISNCLITGGEDNKLRIWKMMDTGDLQLHKTCGRSKGPIDKVVVFGSLVYTISNKEPVMRSWEMTTLEKGPEANFEGHTGGLTDIAVDKHSKTPIIYTASYDRTIRMWDGKNPQQFNVLEGHTDAVTCVKVGLNFIISGSVDTTVRIWDKKKLACLQTITHHSAVIVGLKIMEKGFFSFDKAGLLIMTKWKTLEVKLKLDIGFPILKLRLQKKIILVVGSKAMEYYNFKGKKKQTYDGHTQDLTTALIYDNDYVFSASEDRTVRLWNIKKNQQIAVFRGHTATVLGIAVWKQWVYTVAPDGTIRQWTNCVYNAQNNMEWVY